MTFEEVATLVVVYLCGFVAGGIVGAWIVEREFTAMIREYIRKKGGVA